MLEAIVAVDRGWGIGNKGELLCRVSADLKNFRAVTTGKTVILGSKTLSTFPGGRPLKNRRNIVLSRRDVAIDAAEVAHSAEEALSMLGEGEEAVVIGGESIYNLFLPYCDTVYVTKFDISLEADAFFPDLDALCEWQIESESDIFISEPTDNPSGMSWKICTYKRTL